MRFLIDAHLDLSWNALSFDRDQRLSVARINQREIDAGMTGKPRGKATVSLPEMRSGGIGVCLATILARAMPAITPAQLDEAARKGHPGLLARKLQPQLLRENLDYASQEIASAVAQGQLAYYRLLEKDGQIAQISSRRKVDEVAGMWSRAIKAGEPLDRLPVGYILSMEGADPIITPEQVYWWWEQGLRTVCLAHYGPSAYAMGTGGDGPLTDAGRKLVRKFDDVGMILDLVHTADIAVDQALDLYTGRGVFVSHGNCRALVPGDRQMSDEQIKRIAERGGVIGAVFDNWMLYPGYEYGKTPNTAVSLAHVANHIDHVCQITGSVNHAAIGSDLDGGFGTEQSPHDLGTIAGVQKLDAILKSRGYSDADIDAVFFNNWLRFFRENLPQ